MFCILELLVVYVCVCGFKFVASIRAWAGGCVGISGGGKRTAEQRAAQVSVDFSHGLNLAPTTLSTSIQHLALACSITAARSRVAMWQAVLVRNRGNLPYLGLGLA